MKCKWATLLPNYYVEQGLGLKRRKILAKHLEECFVCQKEVERLATTVKIIREMEEIDPPRDYVESVRVSLKDTEYFSL